MAMKSLFLVLMALALVACSSNGQIQSSAGGCAQPPAEAASSEQMVSGSSLISTLLKQRPNWLEAQFIDVDSFPETITSVNRETFNESDMVFVGVIPGTEEPRYFARVGVFENRQNQKGRFLVIFDAAGHVVQVLEDSVDGAAYSALILMPGVIRWYKCFECGDYEMLSRTPSGFVID